MSGFGCDISSNKTSSKQKSVTLIPKELGIKGVVIQYQSKLYGIYDCNVNAMVIPFVWSKIYSDTDNKSGVTSYYMESPTGEKVDLKQFLIDNNLVSENGEEEEEEPDDTASTSSSFTEEMNNLSTKGRLQETTSEDDQYFENLDDTNTETAETAEAEDDETSNTEEQTSDGEEQDENNDEVN